MSVDLEAIRVLMRRRDTWALQPDPRRDLRALADEVPGPVAEVERLRAKQPKTRDEHCRRLEAVMSAHAAEIDRLTNERIRNDSGVNTTAPESAPADHGDGPRSSADPRGCGDTGGS